MARAAVLYVEDEEFDAMFMRRAFKQAGLEQMLEVVVDGQQAIDYLAGNHPFEDRTKHPLPSLVLLDLNLPLISGFDVLKWMRGQRRLQSLPVVVFSSSARAEDKLKADELGADEYLAKPGSGLEFLGVVQQLQRRWLTLGSTPAGPPEPSA